MAIPAEFDAEMAVIAAAGQGDRHAFRELWRANDRWVRGVIFGVLGKRDPVEDVSQQVWASAWRRIGELRDARRWRPWLYRIARNAALDAGRDLSRRNATAIEGDCGPVRCCPPSPPQALMDGEQRSAVMEAIGLLPAIYREPFVLRHLQDWSYQEIGQTMGIPVDTVETRLVRARRLLRQHLAGKV